MDVLTLAHANIPVCAYKEAWPPRLRVGTEPQKSLRVGIEKSRALGR